MYRNISRALMTMAVIGAFCFKTAGATSPTTAQVAKTATKDAAAKSHSDSHRDSYPDFAFPDRVAADASLQLHQAMMDGDSRQVVKSLVIYSLARNAVSPDLLTDVILRIDSVKRADTNPLAGSLLSFLEAKIYMGLYSRNRWDYDSRIIPGDSLSSDPTAWSGSQYKQKILSLLDDATRDRENLLQSPLQDWSDIIEADPQTYILYPTLYDLIAYNAIDMFNELGGSNQLLPARYGQAPLCLQPYPAYASVNEYSRRAHALSISLVEAHRDRIPALITALIGNLNCSSFVTRSDHDKTIDEYIALYNRYADSEWGAEALLAISYAGSQSYLAACRQALDRFPSYYRANELRSVIERITRPSASFSSPGYVTPGVPFEINVDINNDTSATLYIYRSPLPLTDNFKPVILSKMLQSKDTRRFTATVSASEMPFSSSATIPVTLDDPGYYIIYAQPSGIAPNSNAQAYNCLICTNIAGVNVNFDAMTYPYALHSIDGAPYPGVTVEYKKKYDLPYKVAGETDESGTLATPLQEISGIRLFHDGNVAKVNYTSTSHIQQDNKLDLHARIFTDLPLYHHGDSVRWVVLTYSTGLRKAIATPGADIKVMFLNANGELVDSARVTTDASGRAAGTVCLPAEGLSGSYRVQVYSDKSYIGNVNFSVNDYRLPTFQTAVTDLRRDSNDPDSTVIVTCNATTYSGFPVSNAKVAVTLADAPSSPWWWRSSHETPFWSTETQTAITGDVTVTLPQHILDLSPSGANSFVITFSVTSEGGETRTCSRSFTLGKPLYIVASASEPIDIDKPFDLKTQVLDANGNPVDIKPAYSFSRDGDIVASDIVGPLPKGITPGRYDITISVPDSTLASPLTLRDIVLYRNSGPCPVKSPLFVPVKSFTASGKLSIPVASYYDDTHILVVKTVDNVIVSRSWYRPRAGMQHYTVDIDPASTQTTLNFVTVRNHRQYKETVTIVNSLSVNHLDITVTSFRDKVIPGTPEEITLRVDLNDNPSPASVILAMQSQALLDLAPYSLTLENFTASFRTPSISQWYNMTSGSTYAPLLSYDYPVVVKPALNFYGMSLGYNYFRNIKIRGSRATVTRKAKLSDDAETVIVEESMPVLYASMTTAGSADMAANDMVAELAVEEEADDSRDLGTDSPEITYRPSEIPLAFFAPMLTTDSAGSLTYTYRVPDANTSWILNALAYTPSMLSATLQRTVTASRPVMVLGTAPRFLRYGDRASLTATAMNATDSMATLVTTITVLDATDMTQLATMTSTDSVMPGAQVVVSLPFETPSAGTALIYRVSTTSGRYSDGEQSLIPLLPITQPVITSTSFYIDADSTSFNVQLEPVGTDVKSTLYMYTNPLWEVVTALPSLSSATPISSSEAINNLYMASVARGILSRYPAMRQGLADWLASDRADSTLVSALSRNDDLKQLAISATPWVRDAQTDTERLTSLALLLDDSNVDACIRTSLKVLTSLACPDGGLAWCPGSGLSSRWATTGFLSLAASLQQRGYAPVDKRFATLVDNAVTYLDDITARQLDRDKGQGDYTEYVYIRSILRGPAPSATFARAAKITINNILRRWEREPVTAKATDAVILYYNRYPSMARKLVSSINAYALNDPAKGRWWYGLDAATTASLLHAIETVTPADEPTIKAVAQWLILAKTNQSWSSTSATSATVDALLGALDVDKAATGSAIASIVGTHGSCVRDGGAEHSSCVIVNDTPQLPGMIVADISDILSGGNATLSVDKTTGLPAMGSVISISTMAFDSIPSTSCPSVSISKRINVIKEGRAHGADTLRVGDLVNIQLVITVTDDLDYVTVIDRRAATLEPVQQLSGYTASDGAWYYREVTDSETRYYFTSLRHGTYVIDTGMNVMTSGEFASGVATLQSQINPSVVANSSSQKLIVK